MRRAVKVQGRGVLQLRPGDARRSIEPTWPCGDRRPRGFTVEDKKIANRVIEAGRALVLVANKWDLVEDKDDAYQQLTEDSEAVRARDRGADLRHQRARGAPSPASCSSTSTIDGLGPGADLEGQRRDPAGAAERPAAPDRGHPALRHQVSTRPPSFVVFGGGRAPDPSYQRYIENRFRRDVPSGRRCRSRMSFRTRTRGR